MCLVPTAIEHEMLLKPVFLVFCVPGVILDPVYSGKAVYQMVQQMQQDPGAWRGKVSSDVPFLFSLRTSFQQLA